MRVMYVTRDPKESFVRYAEREDKLEGVVVADVKRYEREHMCDAPANQSIGWRDPGYVHDALITGLGKGKRYYYKVVFSFLCVELPVTLLFLGFALMNIFCFLL